MGTDGSAWLAACAALGVAWVLAASWRAECGTMPAALRGLFGGLGALGTTSIGYGLMQLAGCAIRWEWIAKGAWPALGFAGLVGLVEEGGKLAGIALAAPATRQGWRASSLMRTTAAVAAVFATAEALLTLRGASWPLALGRAAFAPVAHGVLAAPMAIALAEAPFTSRWRLAARVAAALSLAALLHGLGDWSVARPGWGRWGFAAALLAPTLWLYVRSRRGGRDSPPAAPSRALTASDHPHQMGGRLFSP